MLDARLAACVQTVGPITSSYVWQGRRETATEWQCLAKTEERLYPEVEAAIRAAKLLRGAGDPRDPGPPGVRFFYSIRGRKSER
ncbi:MAG TPA: divalent cation tolerance protein CutA [Solirubrobacterales bacterium]